MKRIILIYIFLITIISAVATPVESIETPYTISKVTTAIIDKQEYIVASSYEGTVVCYTFAGKSVWQNTLSGFYNHDIYCDDIDGDGSSETLAANSDGNLYCLDKSGRLIWQFSDSKAPLNAVSVIRKDGVAYIACGGYEANLYYLDAKGNMLSKTPSSSYSLEKGWGIGGPKVKSHIANFIRTAQRSNGDEVLVLHGVINSMSSRGGLYYFEPLATTPYKRFVQKANTVIGDMAINNLDSSGNSTILMGSSKDTRGGYTIEADLEGREVATFSFSQIAKAESYKFGYRVAQSEMVLLGGNPQRVILFGSFIMLPTDDNTAATTEILVSKYAYNDLAKDSSSTKLILASEQGGGNCIHIIDLKDKGWMSGYKKLSPQGNIAEILAQSDVMRCNLDKFSLPKWEDLSTRPVVCFMSENPNRDAQTKAIVDPIQERYSSPIFLNGGNSGGSEDPALWQRDTMSNEFYRTRRDRRQKYKNSQATILKNVARAFEEESKGMSMWGGHGNDPFYYSPDTQHKIMSLTGKNQQTVMIFPEMEGRGDDVVWLMNSYIYPMADHAQKNNTKLFIRSKHAFWFGNVYEHQWSRLISGDYADVFVPSMEETTDKSMELSLMGRMGVWMSGAVDSWGTRCARDNPSYNRLRQFSHQNLPNHFLRNMVYHISLGAQYIDNFEVDQEYMSLLWEMIAKGLLYVPKREEIVSLNPVRLSIVHPDQAWLNEGNNVKWVTLFDEQKEEENPWAIGRLSGTWSAAPTTEWDYSRYAAGAKERRLNFISSFNNGHVLLTPPYDKDAPRGKIEERLHPLYKGITKEFFTDGRNYYADAERTQSYSPKEYYKVVESAIEEGAKLLPLTVKGEVGWVAAQSAPQHLRVTIIDGGYINPSTKEATIVFGTAKVKSVTDLASGKTLEVKDGECRVTVPCGLFLFLDVELAEKL